MTRLWVLLPLLAASSAAEANAIDCGDNAYTYAEVVKGPPGVRAKGPVVSVPETLCADLIEERPRSIDSLSVHIGEPRSLPGDAPGAVPSERPAPDLGGSRGNRMR